ncbi:hypothetical protein E2C01_051717 [Portunus trituberculatus]|uniref:Uncharacterized protein n=1 Tax=Portunus trituberculatus TaxID=210409 RepID=A0A5B7GBS3_PORTR|nr:hypothetical protein [Portunus trituberculatus]
MQGGVSSNTLRRRLIKQGKEVVITTNTDEARGRTTAPINKGNVWNGRNLQASKTEVVVKDAQSVQERSPSR